MKIITQETKLEGFSKYIRLKNNREYEALRVDEKCKMKVQRADIKDDKVKIVDHCKKIKKGDYVLVINGEYSVIKNKVFERKFKKVRED